MADLPLDSSALPVVLIGATTTGSPTTPAAVDSTGALLTGRPASYATGSITALNGAVTLALLEGQSAWDIYYTGTFSAGTTIQFQGSLDGTNWFNLNGRRSGDATTNDTTTQLATDVIGTPNSNWRGNVAGLRYLRSVATTFQTGDSITVQISTSTATGATFLNAAIPPGTNTIGQVYSTSASGFSAAVSGFNRLNVSPEPSDLLSDKFETSVLDPNRWTQTLIGSGTDVVVAGNLTLATGTTASNASIVTSVPLFTQKANVQLSFGVSLKIEPTPLITGGHRFWGLGTPNLNTAAAPLTDAVGFEIDTSGLLNAVIWAGGAKVYSFTLTPPTDGKNHRYNFVWRTDKVVFYLDSGDVASAISTQVITNSQVLPARFHSINGTSTMSGAPTYVVTAIGISDTGRNSTAISDGTYGFRKASVTATSDLHTQDTINTSLLSGAISVTTTSVEAKVSTNKLVARKVLVITPTNGVIYWGYSNAVTSASGTPIFKNQSLTITCTDNVPVWLIGTATTDVRIVEGS